jgi:leader peptidase (prepilin peptidase)/N-methyltransferase|tara:strand:+ start:649 stop:1110 length:462 start_codon:yes stop_codon:yes gene_type:complete
MDNLFNGVASIVEMSNSHLVFWLTIVGTFSLLVGSFLNVVIYRLPIMIDPKRRKLAGETFNLSKPDSHCPKCDAKIKAWQNIPILSWVVLRGRCYDCDTPIPYRYPLIEFLVALLSVLIAYFLGPTLFCLISILACWFIFTAAVISLDQVIKN